MACGVFGPSSAFLDRPTPTTERPVSAQDRAIGLHDPDLPARFTLPQSNRPDGAPAPESFGLLGAFEHHANHDATAVYRAPLPFHASLLPSKLRGTHDFGSSPPPGLVVERAGEAVWFERLGMRPNHFGFDQTHLYIGVAADGDPPRREDFEVTFPRATNTEDDLNLATSPTQDPGAFARRSFTLGTTSHTGLYLPAPATAVFDLTPPAGAVLTFDATLLPPAIASATVSDGATVSVSVTAEGRTTVVGTHPVLAGTPAPMRFDLTPWAGRPVSLQIQTEPGATTAFDYVLLAAPVLYTPDPDPERIVLVFVDTLRPDHLGLYGYERPTSPLLDRWAAHGAVFTQARSVAPWTLPSARAALTGRQPEDFYAGPTLASALSQAGWRTEALVANAFLSQPFDVHRGWDRYVYDHLAPAADVVDHARAVLAHHSDRDVLLMVHFMEPHLPYNEPLRQRRRFSGSRPAGLKNLARGPLTRMTPDAQDYDAIRRYVTGRYDQNIRTVDDALLPLLAAAGDDATVLLFSDHGEELWDHGGFEHGHAMWDELLRVPLAIRSPGLPAGRHDAPVSLLDVTPTLLEIAGLPVAEGPGRSLVGVAWGDPGAAEALAERAQAFGRPLYGAEAWGVLSDSQKWVSRAGAQTLFELTTDPGEHNNLAPAKPDPGTLPAALGRALGRKVEPVWRLTLDTIPNWPHDIFLVASHPDGLENVWKSYDPRGKASEVEPERVHRRVQLVLPARSTAPDAIYLQPGGDPWDPDGLVITLMSKHVRLGERLVSEPLTPTAERTEVLTLRDKRLSVSVDIVWAPEPGGVEVSGFHQDLAEQLRELGYTDP